MTATVFGMKAGASVPPPRPLPVAEPWTERVLARGVEEKVVQTWRRRFASVYLREPGQKAVSGAHAWVWRVAYYELLVNQHFDVRRRAARAGWTGSHVAYIEQHAPEMLVPLTAHLLRLLAMVNYFDPGQLIMNYQLARLQMPPEAWGLHQEAARA